MAGKEITIRSGASPLQAYLALPEAPGPHPGVVVIHEVFGLNQNIRDIADRFTGEGYGALAVDLFSGRNRAICMIRVMGGMLGGSPDRWGVSDLKAALGLLSELPQVDAGRVSAIGFCMGGAYAIAWACSDRRLKAIAPFYGANPRPIGAVSSSCPMVGSYPGKDFTTGAGRKLEAELAKHGIAHDMKFYPQARHSFFNDRGAAYDEAAAKDSWQRVMTFFDHHVRQFPSQPSP